LRLILSTREAWGCILVRVLFDPVSYFYIFWMPKFLQQERGFDLKAIGKYYWIPFVASAAGNIAGGAIPRSLARRGWSLNRARKTVMAAATCFIPATFILITRVPGPVWALALLCVAMFCHAAWGFVALPAEVCPERSVGSVAGLSGAMGALVGAVTMLVIGHTLTVSSFTPIFVTYSAAPVLAFIALCALIRNLGHVRELPVASGAV
jgi:ACS family hexuronate transporter-like MFS transporter